MSSRHYTTNVCQAPEATLVRRASNDAPAFHGGHRSSIGQEGPPALEIFRDNCPALRAVSIADVYPGLLPPQRGSCSASTAATEAPSSPVLVERDTDPCDMTVLQRPPMNLSPRAARVNSLGPLRPEEQGAGATDEPDSVAMEFSATLTESQLPLSPPPLKPALSVALDAQPPLSSSLIAAPQPLMLNIPTPPRIMVSRLPFAEDTSTQRPIDHRSDTASDDPLTLPRELSVSPSLSSRVAAEPVALPGNATPRALPPSQDSVAVPATSSTLPAPSDDNLSVAQPKEMSAAMHSLTLHTDGESSHLSASAAHFSPTQRYLPPVTAPQRTAREAITDSILAISEGTPQLVDEALVLTQPPAPDAHDTPNAAPATSASSTPGPSETSASVLRSPGQLSLSNAPARNLPSLPAPPSSPSRPSLDFPATSAEQPAYERVQFRPFPVVQSVPAPVGLPALQSSLVRVLSVSLSSPSCFSASLFSFNLVKLKNTVKFGIFLLSFNLALFFKFGVFLVSD